MGWQWGFPRRGPFLPSRHAMLSDLTGLPRVTLLEFVGLEKWTELRSCAGPGPLLGRSPPSPLQAPKQQKAEPLRELLGWGLDVGNFHKMKAGLGDVSPLLACAGREALAVAVCYPFSTLDTF